jgi:hypothetical protein
MRAQWEANVAAERGLSTEEVMRAGQVEQLSQGDLYIIRRMADDSTFSLDVEDQSVPDDGYVHTERTWTEIYGNNGAPGR